MSLLAAYYHILETATRVTLASFHYWPHGATLEEIRYQRWCIYNYWPHVLVIRKIVWINAFILVIFVSWISHRFIGVHVGDMEKWEIFVAVCTYKSKICNLFHVATLYKYPFCYLLETDSLHQWFPHFWLRKNNHGSSYPCSRKYRVTEWYVSNIKLIFFSYEYIPVTMQCMNWP
jgi:hypothetical protein